MSYASNQGKFAKREGLHKDKYLEDFEPCEHKGCLNHVTHPCEGCGRIAGQNKTIEKYK